jgi:hypothetical protein
MYCTLKRHSFHETVLASCSHGRAAARCFSAVFPSHGTSHRSSAVMHSSAYGVTMYRAKYQPAVLFISFLPQLSTPRSPEGGEGSAMACV